MFENPRGKRALLTGASRGLGVHIAKRLAQEGVDLVLAARDRDKLDEVVGACRAFGVSVDAIAADVSSAGDRARLVRESGVVDILINNAGVEHPRRLVSQTDAEVRAQIEINLVAPIELTRAVLPGMLERRSGVIVNVSSMSGKGATPFNSVYAATKHGLNGFSASLGIELDGTGVHVGVVCPGFVSETGMWANTGKRAPLAFREVSPEAVAKAVLRAIRGDREVLVTPGPVRPLLALGQLLPGIEGAVLRAMGVSRVLAERAGEKLG